MKNYLLLVFTFFITLSLSGQSVFGKWMSVDNETGEEKSVVEIYEDKGKVFGKIIKILNPEVKDALCENCEGDEYQTPVLGLTIIKALKKSGKHYKGGTVFDPERGKKYKCRIWLDEDNPDILNVRGYVAFLYATQYWTRVE